MSEPTPINPMSEPTPINEPTPTSQAAAGDPRGGDQQYGPVGQRIILENDRVRVWQVMLEPGETQPMHRHELPYVVVSVQGAINVIHTLDGQVIDAPEPTGGVVFREPGAIHMLTNVGETRYVGRIIELKS